MQFKMCNASLLKEKMSTLALATPLVMVCEGILLKTKSGRGIPLVNKNCTFMEVFACPQLLNCAFLKVYCDVTIFFKFESYIVYDHQACHVPIDRFHTKL